jgi:hypothetical protein
VRQCVQVHCYTLSCSEGTSALAREEDAASVYGYTGTLHASSYATLGASPWGAGGARCGRGSAWSRPAQRRAWQISLATLRGANERK